MIHQRACHRFTKTACAILAASLCSIALPAGADDASTNARVTASAEVFQQLDNASSGIPHGLLNQAACVIILPSVKKAGFIVGAQYGKGLMSCRSGPSFTGRWHTPIMMQSSGGSFGLQAGGQATDFVVLVMNDEGARAVIKGNAKLGADATVAAGPVGRDAEASTTGTLNAQMLSYSRTKGVFAGISLAGTSLGPDAGANEDLYGKKISGAEIFSSTPPTPPSATALLSELQRTSPKRIKK
jgi:SH3 domain-containing YSC84-like protein 1